LSSVDFRIEKVRLPSLHKDSSGRHLPCLPGAFLLSGFRFGAGMLIKNYYYDYLLQTEERGMKKDCVYMNKCYRHGSALELTGDNLLCNDGKWEKGLDLPEDRKTKAPGKGMSDI
jgi:hypothetical protein